VKPQLQKVSENWWKSQASDEKTWRTHPTPETKESKPGHAEERYLYFKHDIDSNSRVGFNL
jgi:hypothetical protein